VCYNCVSLIFEKDFMMEKHIVTIDVGSVCETCYDIYVVEDVNLEREIVCYKGDTPISDNFSMYLDHDIAHFKLINGISVSEIEKIRIAGYNDKITLKIEDTLQALDDNEVHTITSFTSANTVCFKDGKSYSMQTIGEKFYLVNNELYNCEDILIPNKITLKVGDIVTYSLKSTSDDNYSIAYFLNHNETDFNWVNNGGEKKRLSTSDAWYVNGVKYSTENIITPTISASETINPTPPSINVDNTTKDLEPIINVDTQLNHSIGCAAMIEITPDNFVELLKYNGYKCIYSTMDDREVYKCDNRFITLPNYIKNNPLECNYVAKIGGSFALTTDFWQDVIDIIIPRLELQPLPKFDFQKYLIEKGWERSFADDPQETDDMVIWNDFTSVLFEALHNKYYYDGEEIAPTQATADTLIKIAALTQQLKQDAQKCLA